MSDAYEVNGLWRYPVKSMAGEAVEDAESGGIFPLSEKAVSPWR